MTILSFWNETWTAAVVNHLWQSTVVVLMAWLLTLALRNNHARTRYWIWMIASLKFLVPFSLLIAAGESLRAKMATPIQQPAFADMMEQFTQPFAQTAASATATSSVAAHAGTASAAALSHTEVWPVILLAVWLCGALAIVFSWARSWWKVRTIVSASTQTTLLGDLPVLSSSKLLEPGVFGIVRPVLLLPKGIDERLTPPQFGTIIAHEMCHIRRRDNLTAAIHMIVETLFWFHPAVWWIKARLLDEREQACDEAVLQSGNDAPLYAESILNVCKFYVESPLACVSGITGADLKRRIVRIMTEQVARKLDLGRKLLLGIAAIVAVTTPVVLGLVHINHVQAQVTTENATGSVGTWQGTLHGDRDLRLIVKVSKDDGKLKAVMYSIDQDARPMSASSDALDDSTFKAEWFFGKYAGKLSADGKSIVGTWSQGPTPRPLTLVRATTETAWEIPAFVPRKAMAVDADPSFDVATIKPNNSGSPNVQGIGFNGHDATSNNTSLVDLICFAYNLQAKQVVGAPDWSDKDRYDIVATVNVEGDPDSKQLRTVFQKLLADRFQLKFHHDKRELSAFVLTVGKDGPKLTPTQFPGPGGGFGLRPAPGGVTIPVANFTMTQFADALQMLVVDRPVVDQTGLSGKYDFNLTFAPDESQFKGHPPIPVTKAPEGVEEAPGFFEAIQQLGLKLEAKKTATEVLVLDRIEKPSAN
ncbi:M56 family metallopeptidase [Granulicella mallensis]|uniref:Uncharacterized protein (TIGR03435 family) n=1 Tax=Granulicella mallensis TaxID=940614 RepID=A0A7W7ZLE9_9BACT|nr:M56 family metallopeptidase [Granulicella mallensis]MBB5062095.1 uncharacterized protein (TIGR03435 family) [Granulicella mallensis]